MENIGCLFVNLKIKKWVLDPCLNFFICNVKKLNQKITKVFSDSKF